MMHDYKIRDLRSFGNGLRWYEIALIRIGQAALGLAIVGCVLYVW